MRAAGKNTTTAVVVTDHHRRSSQQQKQHYYSTTTRKVKKKKKKKKKKSTTTTTTTTTRIGSFVASRTRTRSIRTTTRTLLLPLRLHRRRTTTTTTRSIIMIMILSKILKIIMLPMIMMSMTMMIPNLLPTASEDWAAVASRSRSSNRAVVVAGVFDDDDVRRRHSSHHSFFVESLSLHPIATSKSMTACGAKQWQQQQEQQENVEMMKTGRKQTRRMLPSQHPQQPTSLRYRIMTDGTSTMKGDGDEDDDCRPAAAAVANAVVSTDFVSSSDDVTTTTTTTTREAPDSRISSSSSWMTTMKRKIGRIPTTITTTTTTISNPKSATMATTMMRRARYQVLSVQQNSSSSFLYDDDDNTSATDPLAFDTTSVVLGRSIDVPTGGRFNSHVDDDGNDFRHRRHTQQLSTTAPVPSPSLSYSVEATSSSSFHSYHPNNDIVEGSSRSHGRVGTTTEASTTTTTATAIRTNNNSNNKCVFKHVRHRRHLEQEQRTWQSRRMEVTTTKKKKAFGITNTPIRRRPSLLRSSLLPTFQTRFISFRPSPSWTTTTTTTSLLAKQEGESTDVDNVEVYNTDDVPSRTRRERQNAAATNNGGRQPLRPLREKERHAWQQMFEEIQQYQDDSNGSSYPPPGTPLRNWADTQRRIFNQDVMYTSRMELLDSIDFQWSKPRVGSPRLDWDKMYGRLFEYRERCGDANVPQDYPEDPQLGTWCWRQKSRNSKGKLDPGQKAMLDGIGFVFHEIVSYDERWNDKYDRLVEYRKKNNSTIVPTHCEEDPELATWISEQRRHYNSNDSIMNPERIERLEAIGFVWNAHEAAWLEMYNRLNEYKQEEGNADVPKRYKKDPKLGRWVGNQRQHYRKGELSPDRIEKLEAIGFKWSMIQSQAEKSKLQDKLW